MDRLENRNSTVVASEINEINESGGLNGLTSKNRGFEAVTKLRRYQYPIDGTSFSGVTPSDILPD